MNREKRARETTDGQARTWNFTKMNKTDGTSKRSFFVLSGPPSSRLSAKALKCTKLTPPFGHPECAYMDQAVVATWNSMRSTPSCNIMGCVIVTSGWMWPRPIRGMHPVLVLSMYVLTPYVFLTITFTHSVLVA